VTNLEQDMRDIPEGSREGRRRPVRRYHDQLATGQLESGYVVEEVAWIRSPTVDHGSH
jgi:hypothetical protein